MRQCRTVTPDWVGVLLVAGLVGLAGSGGLAFSVWVAPSEVAGFGGKAGSGGVMGSVGLVGGFLAGQVKEGLECPSALHSTHFLVGVAPCFIASTHFAVQ